MKSAIRTAVNLVGRRAPLAFWQRVRPKTSLGFCYHIVSDERVPHVRHYPILDTAAFEADLTAIERRFGWISYDALARRLEQADEVRDNSAILTFDDGFAECATVVAPILLRRGIDCVFFVITDLVDGRTVFRETEASLCVTALEALPIDQAEALVTEFGLDSLLRPPPERASTDFLRLPLHRAGLDACASPKLRALYHWLLTVEGTDVGRLRALNLRLGIDPVDYVRKRQPYLTQQQIRDLRAMGFTIGAHSLSHRLLQSLSPEEAKREIAESCRIICELTGQKSAPFAFPYFGGGIDRDWLVGLRRDHDFIGLCFDTDGLREDEPFVVQRVFGERMGFDSTLDGVLRRAWARPTAWRRRASGR